MRIFLLLVTIGLPPLMAGCGYVVGNGFAHDVRTIHVPMFTSDSFRRQTAERVTEAVHKQIESRTPYRLVTVGDQADTRLVGHIVDVRKDPLFETRFDDVRELQVLYAVQLRWEDLRTGALISSRTVPLDRAFGDLTATGTLIPEVGQSFATSEQAAIDQIARDVVNLLETPW